MINMKWLEDLDQRIVSTEERESKVSLTRGMVEISLNLLSRFALTTDSQMRMHPEQWDVARYHGDKRWEIREGFDFGELGEILLMDESPRGAGMFFEFTMVKGRNTIRSGFIIPERIGEESVYWFFVAFEMPVRKASLGEVWSAMRPGIGSWYESLIRGDMTPLAQLCERGLEKRVCPSLPGKL